MKNVKPPRLGVAIIVSGPSGAGKSTVTERLRAIQRGLDFSVSCTTRAPREGEKHGESYFFISERKFEKRIAAGEFLEYARVHGNLYGTLASEVTDRVRLGRDVLLDIDIQGATQVRKRAETDELLQKCLETVFIGPPSFSELERRLRTRATESEEVIRLRLENAKKELTKWSEYEYLIINKDIDKAVADLNAFFDIMRKKTKRLQHSGFFI
ncbi:MAG: guanylate kinase [Kiritimatiellaeota bacterium]|nr:guanylate kinase [Kiritimatiellota bacterium]